MCIERSYLQNKPVRIIYVSLLLIVFTPCVASKLFKAETGPRCILVDVEFSARFMVKSGNRIVEEQSMNTDGVSDIGFLRNLEKAKMMLYYSKPYGYDSIEFNFRSHAPHLPVELKINFIISTHLPRSGNVEVCFESPVTGTIPTQHYSYACLRHERHFYHQVPCEDSTIPTNPDLTFSLEVDMKSIRAQGFGVVNKEFSRSIECKGYSNQAGVISVSVVGAMVLIAIVVVVVVLVLRRRKQSQNCSQESNERSGLRGVN